MKKSYSSGLFLLGIISLFASVSFAAEIALTDCSGVTTAIKQVESSSPSQITLDVLGPVDTVTLTNVTTGQAMTAPVKNGRVSFDRVSTGTWKACAQSGNFVVQNVNITTGDAITNSGPSLLGVVGGAAAFGLGALAITTSGDSDSDSSASVENDLPGFDGGGSAPAESVSTKRPSGGSGSGSTNHGGGGGLNANSTGKRPSTNANCFVGTDVTPMSPFS